MHALSVALFSTLLVAAAPAGPGYLGVFLETSAQAVVAEVVPGTAAAAAGLSAGDVLLSVDGVATPTRQAFVSELQKHAAAAQVRIQLRRGGRERAVVVTLGARPQPRGPGAEQPAGEVREEPRAPQPAVEVAERPGGRGYLGLRLRPADGRAVIDAVVAGGPAAAAGAQPGDVVVRFGERAVRTPAELERALAASGPGKTALLRVRRGGRVRQLTVTTGRAPGEVGDAARAGVRPVVEAREPGAAERADRRAGANGRDVRGELQELRRQLRELRRQLEELRRGRE